jgi:hypothetical protein
VPFAKSVERRRFPKFLVNILQFFPEDTVERFAGFGLVVDERGPSGSQGKDSDRQGIGMGIGKLGGKGKTDWGARRLG